MAIFLLNSLNDTAANLKKFSPKIILTES
jgi:hypothetical protein